MTWTPTKTVSAGGAWHIASRWNPSGVPTIDDYVQVDGYIFTDSSDTDLRCAGLYVTGTGGWLQMGAGTILNVKDAAGTHADGSHIRFDSNALETSFFGNPASPVVIKSYTGPNPTNRIRISVANPTGYDARQLNLFCVEFRDSVMYLGDGTNELFFNTGDVTNDGIINLPSKVRREQKYNSHLIPGRNAGRITRVGGHPGTLDISGILPWNNWREEILQTMVESSAHLSFVSQYTSMGRCRIENLRPGEPRGMWQPFSLTLVEDI